MTTPLSAYADARRELVTVAMDLRTVKDELELAEAAIAQGILADKSLSNDAKREAALTLALNQHGTVRHLRRKQRDLEARKDALEAEADIAAKFIAAEQWTIRARLVEVLEAQGAERGQDGALDRAVDAAVDGLYEAYQAPRPRSSTVLDLTDISGIAR